MTIGWKIAGIILMLLVGFAVVNILFGENDPLEGNKIVRCEKGRKCYIEGEDECINKEYMLYFDTLSECKKSIH